MHDSTHIPYDDDLADAVERCTSIVRGRKLIGQIAAEEIAVDELRRDLDCIPSFDADARP